MSNDYDEIDEFMDWEEMENEYAINNSQRHSKPTGCCLLPCLSVIMMVCILVGLFVII